MNTKDRGDAYETLVCRLLARLHGLSPYGADLAANVKVQGLSTTHQIDILWEPRDPATGTRRTILIECKDHASPVKQKDLLAFKAVVDDVAAVSPEVFGVFVSSVAYQAGAHRVAETYGVLILELREPTDRDVEGIITGFDLTIDARMPRLTGWNVDAIPSAHGAELPDRIRVPADCSVRLPGGRIMELRKLMLDGELAPLDREPTASHLVTRTFDPPAELVGLGLVLRRVSVTISEEPVLSFNTTVGGREKLAQILMQSVTGSRVWFTDDGKMYGSLPELRADFARREGALVGAPAAPRPMGERRPLTTAPPHESMDVQRMGSMTFWRVAVVAGSVDDLGTGRRASCL